MRRTLRNVPDGTSIAGKRIERSYGFSLFSCPYSFYIGTLVFLAFYVFSRLFLRFCLYVKGRHFLTLPNSNFHLTKVIKLL